MATRSQKQAYANELIISQLGDSENYKKFVQFIGEAFDSIDDVLHYISTINIFQAENKWLDLIGIIVGLDRAVPTALTFDYFNFGDYVGAKNMDEGRWYEAGEPLTSTTLLPDSEYRIALFAQIAKNYGDVSGPGIVYCLQNMLGDRAKIKLYRGVTGGNFTIEITDNVSSNFLTLINELDIIPRAAGIGYSVIIKSPGAYYFGYADINADSESYGIGRYAKSAIPPVFKQYPALTTEDGFVITTEDGFVITGETSI